MPIREAPDKLFSSLLNFPHDGVAVGLFNLFGKKKDSDAAELMTFLAQHQIASRADAVDADTIPEAYGPFGLCGTNPIPTAGISGSKEYLARLRTAEGWALTATRMGSTRAPDVTSGAIDAYQVSVVGAPSMTLYLCPYHKRNSERAPDGFILAASDASVGTAP